MKRANQGEKEGLGTAVPDDIYKKNCKVLRGLNRPEISVGVEF